MNWELATEKIAALIGDHFFAEFDEELAQLIVSNSRMWVIINTSPHSLSTAKGPAFVVRIRNANAEQKWATLEEFFKFVREIAREPGADIEKIATELAKSRILNPVDLIAFLASIRSQEC